MIAVIKGDIKASRKLVNQEKWLAPLKKTLSKWGRQGQKWEVVWGDFFQVEIGRPEDVLLKALKIKALIKRIKAEENDVKSNGLDVRMAIGIGKKTYAGKTISESNGPAYIHAAEKFENLKKEKTSIAIKSEWCDFDEEFNLYLRLAASFMDNWSVSSAELVDIVLQNPNITQKEIGHQLGITQHSVSGRWRRANVDEIVEIEKTFRKKLKILLG